MNYREIYNKLIETRKRRTLIPGMYYENHHIVMRSMGGSNEPENLVMLTAREHFLAHWLLWRIHRKGKNSQIAGGAFFMMCNAKNRHRKFRTSSRSYAEAREAHAISASISLSGKKKTAEACKNMSIAATNSRKGKFAIRAKDRISGELKDFNSYSHACRTLGTSHYDISANIHPTYEFFSIDENGVVFSHRKFLQLFRNDDLIFETEKKEDLLEFLTREKFPNYAKKHISQISLRKRTFREWSLRFKTKLIQENAD